MKDYYVYIMASQSGVLYTGMTSDLEERVFQHKEKVVEGFTSKYNIKKLLYYETTTDVYAAIEREKQIKSWRRSKKINLIRSMNQNMVDLSEDWYE